MYILYDKFTVQWKKNHWMWTVLQFSFGIYSSCILSSYEFDKTQLNKAYEPIEY